MNLSVKWLFILWPFKFFDNFPKDIPKILKFSKGILYFTFYQKAHLILILPLLSIFITSTHFPKHLSHRIFDPSKCHLELRACQSLFYTQLFPLKTQFLLYSNLGKSWRLIIFQKRLIRASTYLDVAHLTSCCWFSLRIFHVCILSATIFCLFVI